MLTQEEAKKILNLAEQWVLAERRQCEAIFAQKMARKEMENQAKDLGYVMEFFDKETLGIKEAEQAKIAFINFWGKLYNNTKEGKKNG